MVVFLLQRAKTLPHNAPVNAMSLIVLFAIFRGLFQLIRIQACRHRLSFATSGAFLIAHFYLLLNDSERVNCRPWHAGFSIVFTFISVHVTVLIAVDNQLYRNSC